MTTLSDQLYLSDSERLWVESRPDILHSTVLSARVGRTGMERHAVRVEVWAPTEPIPANEYHGILPAKPATVGGGHPYCGSRQRGASSHSYSLTAPVTCERCLAKSKRFGVEAMPEDVIAADKWGRMTPKEA